MKATVLSASLAAVLLGACGQTGKLYLPESQGEVVTRPTQTPPPETSPDQGKTSNSPQTVDSPVAPASPAPEVTRPDGKNKKGGTPNPPPDTTPKN